MAVQSGREIGGQLDEGASSKLPRISRGPFHAFVFDVGSFHARYQMLHISSLVAGKRGLGAVVPSNPLVHSLFA